MHAPMLDNYPRFSSSTLH